MSEIATPEAPAKAPPQSPLFDLLARSWQLDAGISDIGFDSAGKAAGFAQDDGRVALMVLEDTDSPVARMRVEADSGRATIRPREKPVAQPIITAQLADGAPLLAVSGVIGLIAAGRDGRIHRITPRGQMIALPGTAAPIHALASDGKGRLAIARDGATDLHDEVALKRLASVDTSGPARALAFAPDDRALAVLLDDGLLLGHPDQGLVRHDLTGSGPLGFSSDGRWLSGANGTDGFWLLRRADGAIARIGKFRSAPSSIGFSRAADAVFVSGAFRAAGWSLANPPLDSEATGALKTGRSGLVLIEKIAAHPTRDLIAIGAADGAVSVARVGQPEEMALRQADGSAVTALRWSPDGLHLAIGTATGAASIVTLPPQVFK